MEGTNKKTILNIIAARSTTTTTTSTSTTTTSARTTTTMKKETTNATSSSTSSSREYYHQPNHKFSFVRNRRVRYYYSTTGTVVIIIIVVSFLLLVHCCWQSTHSILRDDYYYQSSTNEEENNDNVNDNLLVLLLQHNNNNNNTNSHSTVSPPSSSSSSSTNHQQRQLTRRTSSSSSSTTETRRSLSSSSEYNDNDDDDFSKSFPQKRPQLPNFSKTGGGGVIVFLHIAKTGGTTIRQNFGRYVDQVYKPFTKAQLDKFGVPLVNEYLTTHDHNKTLLLELHGNHGDPVPGIIELEPYLQQWRTLSQQNNNNKSLFVFTLLREPISWYISYFNFFKHSKCHYHWCDPPLYENLTESNLLQASAPPRPNHQCTYLARRYTRNHAQMSNVTSLECQQVQQLLFFQSNTTIIDWVGTTEQLQTDTIPLLAYMLVFSKNNTQLPATTTTITDNNSSSSSSRHSSSFYQNFTFRATHNQRPNRLKSISQHGKEMLQRISKWDLQLYQNAQQQYQIQSLWPKDYPAIVQIQQEFKKVIIEQQQQQQQQKQQAQQKQQRQQRQQRQQEKQEKQQKQQEQQKQSIPLDTEKQLEQIQSLMRIRPAAAAATAAAAAAAATATTTTTTSK